MKKRELKELRELSVKELAQKLEKLEGEKLTLITNIHTNQESNLRSVTNIRRDIAQILGIISEKK